MNQRTRDSWLTLIRIPFHTAGLFPLTLGMLRAWNLGHHLNWAVFTLGNIAIVLILLVTYLAGEYHDHKCDSLNKEFNMFSVDSRVLQAGLLPRRHV